MAKNEGGRAGKKREPSRSQQAEILNRIPPKVMKGERVPTLGEMGVLT